MPPAPDPVAAILQAHSDLTREVVERHLARFGGGYLATFDSEAIAAHCRAVESGSGTPSVGVERDSGGLVRCTVVGPDRRGVFSLITGILGANGFSIVDGRVFTGKREERRAVHRRRHGHARRRETVAPTRPIVDTFRGALDAGIDVSTWGQQVGEQLTEAVNLLLQGEDGAALARRRVHERVAQWLEAHPVEVLPALYPVEVEIRNETDVTELCVVSQDTPMFLYSLSNALTLKGISIEGLTIATQHGQVDDRIEVLDRHGRQIRDSDAIAELRFTVLLTKQFTYFLGTAPNPYAALTRFEHLAGEIFHEGDRGAWTERFADPAAMRDLARILGTSDFLWEDFIRSQHELLLPILGIDPARRFDDTRYSPRAVAARLEHATAGCADDAEFRAALNRWKDSETFQIDLHNILEPGPGVRRLAEQLVAVAETVIRAAGERAFAGLARRHGLPRAAGGTETPWAICGLGKLGGVALGYASDIELLLVYSDSGHTDGAEPISNAEFFEKMVRGITSLIDARREGVFEIDLRLRPYGAGGPLACSLGNFIRYYGPGGHALSYERLALVRLRAIAGDPDLGSRIERLRDEFVYESQAISIPELQELRLKQYHLKGSGKSPNAKFSSGALADIEYCVQMLQISHGGTNANLRTPQIHTALEALSEAGVLEPAEAERLTRAYYFLRELINALRMLRGNAKDLDVPATDTLEYRHLARRMGYERKRDLDPGRQLFLDFETQTARVRRFVERHFGRERLPGKGKGNVVDVLLAEQPDPELCGYVFGRMGMADQRRALVNFRSLAGEGARRDTFYRLAVLAADMLQLLPDPDLALNNWERFVQVLPDPGTHFREMLVQPRRLEILLGIFSVSQFLADTLIRDPSFLPWVTDPEVLQREFGVPALRREYDRFLDTSTEGRLNAMRRFRRREILRIGAKDLFLSAPMLRVTRELSALAQVLIQVAAEGVCEEIEERDSVRGLLSRCCLLAYGKLGGNELNYSSDIDLVGVYDPSMCDPADGSSARRFARLFEGVQRALTRHTPVGYVYRVDFRLRPYGRAGALALPCDAWLRYYREEARPWELQALLKARPVAGNLELGRRILEQVKPALCVARSADGVAATVRTMRENARRVHVPAGTLDVKTGVGGIRDVEFLVQALQLLHLHEFPDILEPNTVEALDRLERCGALGADHVRVLVESYTFLRRVEHFLQVFEDQQVHVVPDDEERLTRLARCLLGADATPQRLRTRLDQARTAAHSLFTEFLSTTHPEED